MLCYPNRLVASGHFRRPPGLGERDQPRDVQRPYPRQYGLRNSQDMVQKAMLLGAKLVACLEAFLR